MKIFPAIDVVRAQAVRLYKGDYDRMTVYAPDPAEVACRFAACGARQAHIVDLEGARDGGTPNLASVERAIRMSGLFVEVGGGVRDMDTIARYLDIGAGRVVLGTSAVRPGFAADAIARFGAEHVAAGADIRDGFVAVKGWRELTGLTCDDFFVRMQAEGVRAIICTDVSRDGAMRGTNRELYKRLAERYPTMEVIASGGVSSLEDVRALRDAGVSGAIIGKAYYTGAIDLKKAIEEANDN